MLAVNFNQLLPSAERRGTRCARFPCTLPALALRPGRRPRDAKGRFAYTKITEIFYSKEKTKRKAVLQKNAQQHSRAFGARHRSTQLQGPPRSHGRHRGRGFGTSPRAGAGSRFTEGGGGTAEVPQIVSRWLPPSLGSPGLLLEPSAPFPDLQGFPSAPRGLWKSPGADPAC